MCALYVRFTEHPAPSSLFEAFLTIRRPPGNSEPPGHFAPFCPVNVLLAARALLTTQRYHGCSAPSCPSDAFLATQRPPSYSALFSQTGVLLAALHSPSHSAPSQLFGALSVGWCSWPLGVHRQFDAFLIVQRPPSC